MQNPASTLIEGGAYERTILCGRFEMRGISPEIPFIDVLKEPEKLLDLVKQKVAVLVERKRKQEEKITIQLGGRFLPLSPFVQEIVRDTILAMISTLKGFKKEGKEKVSIVIK